MEKIKIICLCFLFNITLLTFTTYTTVCAKVDDDALGSAETESLSENPDGGASNGSSQEAGQSQITGETETAVADSIASLEYTNPESEESQLYEKAKTTDEAASVDAQTSVQSVTETIGGGK